MSDMYRTRTMDQISEGDIGAQLKIAGWVENIRDHGGVSFIDLRDMYGVMQVVLRDTSLLDHVRKEECLSVEGVIQHRDEETFNPKIPTGTIELEAHKIDILGKVYRDLPFEIATSKEIREDVRLKYRYLDMRNRKVKDNILFRSKVIRFLREKMEDMGFVEVQTPILCASSPEGARDYVVPSRKYKGKFYALPQAPQQYKQLLMVSGIDKYYQIAPCFRDEDARADRSPGEFYQLDFEMAFATQEDVFKIGEEVLTETFKKFAPEGSVITEAPYPIFSYKEAMLQFGSDKPDLRNPLRIIDVTDFFQRCTFKPFHGQTVRAINVHAKLSKGQHEKLLKFAQSIGMGGLGYLEVKEELKYKGPIDKFIPDDMKMELAEMAGLQEGDTIFFIAAPEKAACIYAGQIRNELGSRLDLLEKDAYRFCYINDFPMYEIDEETGKLGFTHNPFSMPQGGLEALNEKDPLDILAYQYDIVCNGVELSSGAVRNHDMKMELAEMAGLQEGDTIFFIAAPEKAACIYAGQIRNELGSRLDLLEKDAYRFCYINDFPMYEIDEETGKLGFTHNPFSMPQGGLEALNEKDPLDILAYQYDIVCNGVELSSGAVRNHDMEIMEKAFDIAGYDKETLKDKFGALYNAFQFGAPPHAGMAPGVDRMIMLLRNEENIREIIAFPMSGTAQDLMCGAPNEITEQQLREVHIKVRD